MNLKNLALISTSLVALGFSATASQAAATMGRIDLGFTQWFDDGGEGSYNWPSVTGWGRVNIPYNDRVNLQLEFFGDGSLYGSGGEGSIGVGNVGAGAHINWRDSKEGLLGIFGATGRVWDTYYYSTPVFMAGLEGQYYCGQWTFYGQAGYMDSDTSSYSLQNAGFVRALVSYYPSPKLKMSAGVEYMAGDYENTYNATAWAWEASGEYWFGKSVPIAVTLKYRGRDSTIDYSSSPSELNSNAVTGGISIFFGGGDIEEADREGNSTEIQDFDNFRLY